jgi:hypothetical protein
MISLTVEPAKELVPPVAREYHVGVGIDEARDDGAASRINHGGAGREGAVMSPGLLRTDEHNDPVVGGDDAVRHTSGIGLCASAPGRRSGAGHDFYRVVNQEVGEHMAV